MDYVPVKVNSNANSEAIRSRPRPSLECLKELCMLSVGGESDSLKLQMKMS